MHTALWVLVAVVLGLILYASIEQDIPTELDFLKAPKSSNTVSGAATELEYQGWTVRQQANAVELVKQAKAVKGSQGTAEVGLLCTGGQLDARLTLSQPPATPHVQVSLDQAGYMPWSKGEGGNAFPPSAIAFSNYIENAGSRPVVVWVKQQDGSESAWALETVGFQELHRQLPANCK